MRWVKTRVSCVLVAFWSRFGRVLVAFWSRFGHKHCQNANPTHSVIRPLHINPFPRLLCRVVAVDMRGYGESDRPSEIADYTLNNMVEDIRALVPALGRCLMYIHSMGELVV